MQSLDELIDGVLHETLPAPHSGLIGATEPKIVRDAVWGMIDLHPHEVLIIDTPLFQRLRGIMQTGFTYLVYPCAVHSRFEHSLGCLFLAQRVLSQLKALSPDEVPAAQLSESMQVTVRLAALLHDISHCVFSHVSESVYKDDERIESARAAIREVFPPEYGTVEIGAAEAVTYHMIVSPRFQEFFDSARKAAGSEWLPNDVEPVNIARLIVGLPQEGYQDKLFLPQIVNGPFDVDKLDYQARDGYFTGVTMAVDVDRLLASLCVVPASDGRYFLAVDHRGIAPVEQLLFNRMLLYDSVYHHHKIRAAVQLFRKHCDNRKLPLRWLLRNNDHDFFAKRGLSADLTELVRRLRHRILLYRAAIIHRSTVNEKRDADSVMGEMIIKHFSRSGDERRAAREWFESIGKRAEELLPPQTPCYVDLPEPPKFLSLQQGTYIKYSAGQAMKLDDVFPISSAINSYAQQCKYRAYVFAERDKREEVAAAA